MKNIKLEDSSRNLKNTALYKNFFLIKANERFRAYIKNTRIKVSL